jgi:uncharacterized protein (TIGR00255 family)
MTGFGEAAGEVDGIVYTLEIRAVNNRYLKLYLRLPEMASFCQETIEKLLRKNIRRGSINYSLFMKNVSGRPLFDVDQNAINDYIVKLKSIAEANNLKCKIDLAQLLTLPAVIQPAAPDDSQAETIKQAVLSLTAQAVEKLKQMRVCEGESIAADLITDCDVIKEKLSMIGDRCPLVIQEYHDKLQKRAQQLTAEAQLNIDEQVLIREIAVFAERSDITEEVNRLDSHINQLRQLCESDQNAGRKLDFISQEMLREANTIASKASDTQISQWVIDIKCAVDRIKEQVQNIE